MEIRTIGLNEQIFPPAEISENNGIKGGNQFSMLLKDALGRVNDAQIESDNYKKLLVTGDLDNLHDLTIAQEKANISLQLTMSIRNKVVEAYREIMRMQI